MTDTNCTCHPGKTCTSAASCATARELHFGIAPAAEVPEAMGDADILTVAEFVGLIGPGSRVGESHDAAVRFGRALLTLQSTRLRSGVPEGFALVPLKPTEEMRSAGKKQVHGESGAMTKCDRMWKAMLTAAPQAPALDAGVVRDVGETGWLIETCYREGCGPTLYLCGIKFMGTETHRRIANLDRDVSRAVRFARREDAEKILSDLADTAMVLSRDWCRVAEHMWPDAAMSAQAGEGGA